MTKQEQLETIKQELDKLGWSVKEKMTKIIFSQKKLKLKVDYYKKEDRFVFVNTKNISFAVMNYIIVYTYFIEIPKEEAINAIQ